MLVVVELLLHTGAKPGSSSGSQCVYKKTHTEERERETHVPSAAHLVRPGAEAARLADADSR